MPLAASGVAVRERGQYRFWRVRLPPRRVAFAQGGRYAMFMLALTKALRPKGLRVSRDSDSDT
jgi:hypothetical protein